ncbi:2Fe-2S iron-sulfur cluster binding domain-containing protein [Ectothiorhodospiraceae bacterium WFHF3C12]|nr:2Fe-2S iron-sulfur cluster binding domain-containing protein [Ectothiorhodospiraceae bacterium WFHF3C12]
MVTQVSQAGASQFWEVEIAETGEVYKCAESESLLKAMERLGRKGIPVGCRGGGCGVCKVQVISGSFESKKMSRAHVSEAEEGTGIVLACRSYPRSDVRLAVLGNIRKSVCRQAPLGRPGTNKQFLLSQEE